ELEEEVPQINLEKDVFRVQSGEESLKIKLQLKGGNKLVVNTFSEGKLINTEEFSIDKEDFTYEYEPKKEKSRLTFSIFSDSIELFSKDVNVRFDSLKDMTAGKESGAKLKIEGKDVAFSPENKKIKIRLSVEEGSRLFVETFVDDEIINNGGDRDRLVHDPLSGKRAGHFPVARGRRAVGGQVGGSRIKCRRKRERSGEPEKSRDNSRLQIPVLYRCASANR
ncbi:MAG: hypothetical protein R6U37_08205, partial [Dehalococcoidia bacterium]